MFFRILLLILLSTSFNCKDIERPSLVSLLLFQGSPENLGVVTSDFGGGGRYNVIDPRGNFALPGLTPIHSDASARFYDGKVIIVNRLNRDAIQVLNPNLGNITEKEFSVGQGTNPHDILFINSNKAYVSRYNSHSILIVNPNLGTTLGEIDLSAYSETTSLGGTPDGLPEMSWMVEAEGRIFIILQKLDRNNPQGFLPPSDESLLLEIDPIQDKAINSFRFQSKNPFSKPQVVNIFGANHIVIATPNRLGFLSEMDGGVEAFNLTTNQFRQGFLLDEMVAGGDILGVQVKSETEGYASVLDRNFNKRILRFRPDTGIVTDTLLEVPNSIATNFSGLLLTEGGLLAIGVSDFNNPGIIIYDTNGSLRRLSPVPIRTELTPTDIIELK